MTTYEQLGLAQRVELAAHAIYTRAAKVADEPDDRALFERLADEELQHAARIALLQRQVMSNPRILVLDEGTEAELRALLDLAEQALRDLDAGAWSLERGALRARLVDMEERMASVHAHRMTGHCDRRVRAFLEALARQDRAHLELLREGAGR